MDPQFGEDEDLEKLKTWWKSNGSSIIAGVVLGIGGIVGFNYWEYYQKNQAEQASVLYEQMMVEFREQDTDSSIAAGGKLMDHFSGSGYAAKAGLILARISVEKSDLPSAYAQLRWVIEHATEDSDHHSARLRLASLMLADGKSDDAIALLKVEEKGGYESRYFELNGDALVQKGEFKNAHSTYQLSLDNLRAGSRYREYLNLKLDNTVTEAKL